MQIHVSQYSIFSNKDDSSQETVLLFGQESLNWNCDDVEQGILSVPGIAGQEWVPARIGRFYK